MLERHENLMNKNGDTVIQNVPASATIEQTLEIIEKDTIHPINWIELSDGSHWWNCDGSELIWGPYETREEAKKQMIFVPE